MRIHPGLQLGLDLRFINTVYKGQNLIQWKHLWSCSTNSEFGKAERHSLWIWVGLLTQRIMMWGNQNQLGWSIAQPMYVALLHQIFIDYILNNHLKYLLS
jgi:hypothetical protein